jgi:hypothetical protein
LKHKGHKTHKEMRRVESLWFNFAKL